jgi:ubiquinone/menaquinone biosynthesis C-methylase UbiE
MSEAAQLFTDGKAYERVMGRWSRLAGDLFLDWLDVPKGLRWLDVGCGNGAFTEAVIARCAPAEVTAVDPSDGQLAYARTRPGATMAQFRLGDAQALAFADGSFDVAAMGLVIVFVADPAKAAAEMARVVRRSGHVATYMWDIEGGGMPLRPIYAAMRSLGLTLPSQLATAASRRDNLQALWEAAGLQSVATQVIRITVTYADFDDFWESNSARVGLAGNAINKLSPPERDELRSLLRKQLPAGPGGRISYEAFANAVKGRAPG